MWNAMFWYATGDQIVAESDANYLYYLLMESTNENYRTF